MPWRFPLLSLISNYDRFGGLSPGVFLEKWWNPQASRGPAWRYPGHGGFLLDAFGHPLNSTVTLRQGTKVDRFGDEDGRYMGAADAPFAQRALPPDALNVCRPPRKAEVAGMVVGAGESSGGELGDSKGRDNEVSGLDGACKPKDHPWGYHVYEVMRDFNVSAGPIAPAFEQPGLGVQFFVGGSGKVFELVTMGLLKPLNLSGMHNGPSESSRCGRNPIKCDCSPPIKSMAFY